MKADWNITTTNTLTNSIIFEISDKTTKITGLKNLCQKIVKRILTTKRSNFFNDTLGTNFFQLFGATDLSSVQKIKEILPILINDLASQIKDEQATDIINGSVLQDDEILESIELASVEFDSTFGGWLVGLVITTKSESITISIP